ncbi:glycosyltransferase family 4 protein [Spirosoma sp. KCTC 42546]|uniref:glycosyltransferase family 4 protein n=1 Tax=Spirosoma sp. KCTC 42546 TaxID=2520506 RepID=UPI0011589595|nr:glycosyltransferase family 1 protein [Spirosoma sp. KCTC 42546]QDK83086.1 glycosyltransferase family 4 protein [Spirosoma sp. KCTC 42546]
MTIFFDHQTFSRHNFGGIPRYFAELISGINTHSAHQAYLSILFSNTVHLDEVGIKASKFFPKIHTPGKKHILYGANTLNSLAQLQSRPFDIFHATYYHPYFAPYLKGKPFVVTFFDMIHELFANQFPELGYDQRLMNQKKKMAKLASRVIAISESTKNDIVELLNIDPNKVDVVYLGSSLPTIFPKLDYISQDVPYILFVGKRDYYKNFMTFLKAICPVLKRYKVKLICAGGGPFIKEEINLAHSLNIGELLEYRSIINDYELQALYQNAIAFAFPSLYEGFGIPILEAFASGCPCVVSDRSSLPEVAGNAALYIDPTDGDSMANGIEKIILDDEVRTNLVLNGYKRLTQFSWQETVKNTINVYEHCLAIERHSL